MANIRRNPGKQARLLRLSDNAVMAVVAKSDGSLDKDNDGADIKAHGDDNF
jgi:hypothetical protein